jgi:hypothetical protein
MEAIKATKEAMFFGIKESQTAILLSKYFEELGMPGGEGLVLFGGKIEFSMILKALLTTQSGRERRFAPRYGYR